MVYSLVPLSKLYQSDLKKICSAVREQLGRDTETVVGLVRCDVDIVRYRSRSNKYVAVKNHQDGKACITVSSKDKPAECLIRNDEIIVREKDGRFEAQLGFNPYETRILRYDMTK